MPVALALLAEPWFLVLVGIPLAAGALVIVGKSFREDVAKGLTDSVLQPGVLVIGIAALGLWVVLKRGRKR